MSDTSERIPGEGTSSAAPAAVVEDGVQPGAGPEREFTVEARSQFKMVLRRFLQHKLAVASLFVLIFMILASLVGGRLWKYDYDELTPEFSSGPTLDHPFGTDGPGHDGLARVLRGAQKSVQIALVVALLSTTFGTLVGAVAGYFRGVVDNILMRLTDLLLVIPSIALFALLANKLAGTGGGNSWLLLSLALAAISWTSIARVVRGVFLSLREKEFVEAARALGAPHSRIIFRHLLPNAVGPIIVNATITVAVAILVETALSFLGLGVKPPDTSLGRLVAEGQQAYDTRPWLFYFPGLFIIVIALSVNFLGDGLRDAFDPTQRRVRA
ncbi:MAG TPA: ABC transporter permease [Acidimicrobiales bacterium]|jgi:peptide/nickel transport system permease protein